MKKILTVISLAVILLATCFTFTGCGDHPLKGTWTLDDGEYYNSVVIDSLTFDTNLLGKCYLSFADEKAYLSSEREGTDGTEYYFSFSEKTGGGSLFDPEVRGFGAKVRIDSETGNLILLEFYCSKMNGYQDVSSSGFSPMTYIRNK